MFSENVRLKIDKFKEMLDRVKNSSIPTSDSVNSTALVTATMPTPSPVKISTITYCVNFNITSSLTIISRYIPVFSGTHEDVQNHVGQVTYVKNIYNLPRGLNDRRVKVKRGKHKPEGKKGKQSNDTKFPNQVTVNFKYCGSRNISLMIFGNGAIKMAGILTEKEGIWITHRIMEILSGIKIKVFNSVQELPNNVNINDFQLAKDATGTIKSYRWLELGGIKKWYAMDALSPDEVNSLTSAQLANNIWHQIDTNFAKLCNINKIKDRIDNTGIVSIKDLVDVDLNSLVPLNITSGTEIKLLKSSICMINSDFNFFFHVKSDVLYKLLSQKYKIDSTYGTHGYQAVKCQFKYNPATLNGPFPGVCKCATHCAKNGSVCKNITISVFQNGNAIITGATSVDQLAAAHSFIVKVVTDNFKELFRAPPTNYKKTTSGRTNLKNKKRQIFVLNKANIKNIENIFN